MIRLHVLGPIELTGVDSELARELLAQSKTLALLVYLLLEAPGGFHRRDRLVGLLWPELDQERARAQLRKALSSIRRTLGPDVLASRGDEEVSIVAEKVWCDAVELMRTFDAKRHERVVELYRRGHLLPGFHVPEAHEYEDWLAATADGLRDAASASAWARATAQADGGEYTSASRVARYAADWAPTNERRLRHVMELLAYRCHDRAAAMKVSEDFARRLRRDFDAEPSEETKALAERIRAGH